MIHMIYAKDKSLTYCQANIEKEKIARRTSKNYNNSNIETYVPFGEYQFIATCETCIQNHMLGALFIVDK